MKTRKPATLDDYAEEVISWAWGWIKGKKIPFSQRKRVENLAKEREEQKAAYDRKYEAFDNGFYLYQATIHDIDKYSANSRVLPYPSQASPDKSKKKATLSEVANFLTDTLPKAGQDVLLSTHENVHLISNPSDIQNNPVGMRNIMAQLTQAHAKHIVQPRLGKVYRSANDAKPILYTDLKHVGERGDVIAQAHALGKIPSDSAHVWIVSSQNPDDIKKQGSINRNEALIFFSEADARLYIKNANQYLSDSEMGKVSNFNLRVFTDNDFKKGTNLNSLKLILGNFEVQLQELMLSLNNKIKEVQQRNSMNENATLNNYMLRGLKEQIELLKELQHKVSNLINTLNKNNLSDPNNPHFDIINSQLAKIENDIKFYAAKYLANDRALIHAPTVFKTLLNDFSDLHHHMMNEKALVSELKAFLHEDHDKPQKQKDEAEVVSKHPEQKAD